MSSRHPTLWYACAQFIEHRYVAPDRLPAAHWWSRGPEDLLHGPLTRSNDTDSFGTTMGSILGAYFGLGGLEARWLAPFHDDLRTGLTRFDERSLAKMAERMRELPGRVAEEIA